MGLRAPSFGAATFQQSRDNLTRFKDVYLKAKASIWPELSGPDCLNLTVWPEMALICSTAGRLITSDHEVLAGLSRNGLERAVCRRGDHHLLHPVEVHLHTCLRVKAI